MSSITTVIADDEAVAREGLRVGLAEQPDFVVVGEAETGPDLVEAINRLEPQLVFLDVKMRGCDGFEALRRISSTRLPFVIFVTAHAQYAVEAFALNAVDYMLKPINAARFRNALQRARERILHSPIIPHSRPDRASEPIPSRRSPEVSRIAVKSGNRHILLRPDDIDWIGAAANYVELHSRSQTYLIRATMDEIALRLETSQFARVHRATIVNLERVREVLHGLHGDSDLVLRDGRKLRLSRTYRERFFALFVLR